MTTPKKKFSYFRPLQTKPKSKIKLTTHWNTAWESAVL